MKLNMAQKRRMVIGVMNWINRQSPDGKMSWENITAAFDDWARYGDNRETVAAMFWRDSSENQIKILRREYNAPKLGG